MILKASHQHMIYKSISIRIKMVCMLQKKFALFMCVKLALLNAYKIVLYAINFLEKEQKASSL